MKGREQGEAIEQPSMNFCYLGLVIPSAARRRDLAPERGHYTALANWVSMQWSRFAMRTGLASMICPLV
jgi:hypothetical protein